MKYFLGFLAAAGLIVLVFILILRGFGGGRNASVQSQLTDYAKTETVMRLVESGPVNADQDHRSISVVIGRSKNTIKLVQGYEGHVLQSKDYDSNESAYTTFLRAIQLQGYTRGNTDPAKADSTGVCPLGKVYTFEIITGSDTVQSFWTTSCGGGTFRGNRNVILQLFRAQIPDYSTIIRGTQLN
ncbi:MAG TPA: hypothetical protein VL737_00200 [Candidatus Pristimantibacillus sp.]|nr:hypothetical protein [Candidatus Pristimantibacillus sp.]